MERSIMGPLKTRNAAIPHAASSPHPSSDLSCSLVTNHDLIARPHPTKEANTMSPQRTARGKDQSKKKVSSGGKVIARCDRYKCGKQVQFWQRSWIRMQLPDKLASRNRRESHFGTKVPRPVSPHDACSMSLRFSLICDMASMFWRSGRPNFCSINFRYGSCVK